MKTFTMSSLVFLIVAIAFIANATGTTLPPTTVSPTTTTPQPTTAVPTTDAPTTTAPSAPTTAAPTTAAPAPGRPRPEWLKCMATAIKCWEEFPKLGEKEFSELGENGSAEFFACCKEKYQEKFQKKIPEECIKEIEMKNILRKFNQQNSY